MKAAPGGYLKKLYSPNIDDALTAYNLIVRPRAILISDNGGKP